MQIARREIALRLVHPARLRHAQSARPFVPRDRMQQRNLAGKRHLVGQLVVGRRTPEHEAAGKRQQMQIAGQIGAANRRRQPLERLEREQIFHATELLPRLPQQRLRPFRQRFHFPMRQQRFAVVGHDAKAGPFEIGEILRRLPISGGQQAADEIPRSFDGPFDARLGVKPSPKRLGRPLLARAEQRPAHAALVVLGARQGQREPARHTARPAALACARSKTDCRAACIAKCRGPARSDPNGEAPSTN